MKRIRFLGLAVFAVTMSCHDATSPPAHIFDLEKARFLWRAQNLHTYAYTLQESCFCGNVHPLEVFVLNDDVSGVIDLQTGASVDRQFGQTIDDLFAFIQHAIDQHAQTIEVEYDAARGFPTSINYDGSAQIADDESFIRISNVHSVLAQN